MADVYISVAKSVSIAVVIHMTRNLAMISAICFMILTIFNVLAVIFLVVPVLVDNNKSILNWIYLALTLVAISMCSMQAGIIMAGIKGAFQ